ncbi:MAG: glycoside hydrolase family 2 protein [Terriglobales bacterium]
MKILQFSARAVLCFTIASLPVFAHSAERERFDTGKLPLHRNWEIQSSCQDKSDGQEISSSSFSPSGWHHAEVPTTVVAALVADKTYPDPYYGMNLKRFPGMDYSSATFFANQSMSADSPFKCSWWFRTEFTLPRSSERSAKWLHFDAINYRANIWLNGRKMAGAQDVAGTYRIFEFEVTKYLVSGKPNTLAVEVFAPDKDDLGMTWVDWNPTPPDKDMGLWKDVYLTTTGSVSLQHPFVTSKLSSDYKNASLTISAHLQNVSNQAVTGKVHVRVQRISVEQQTLLQPGESKTITFTADQYPQLQLVHPRLWWPYQMGTPEMYTAKFEVTTGGRVSDNTEVRFGVREVTSQLGDKGQRLFTVNGRRVLIRGAAWAPDMLLRWSPEQASAALEYTRDMGLNAIRLEGRMERDEFFDMADRLGILIMPGWTCCDMWERWKEWTPDTMKIAAASLADQLTRLRNHPSVFVWLYGSDNPPPANVETMYLQILKERKWPNPSVSSASQQSTTVTGASGVKMTGPYDYVPPNYWLTDTQAGGARGFNTETSPGPAIPPLESLKKFIPADHLWPIDEYWTYHAGGERFTNIDKFINGMDQRYGKAANLEDFLRKSQAMNYEAQRAMFEAYARNKYVSTGVIQWMLNNAWPSLIWHLYDFYLEPAGGYFGTKKACEPLHVQYSYDDNSVAIINGYDREVKGLKVKAGIFNLDAKQEASAEVTLDVPADSSSKALALPAVKSISTTYFLKLDLFDDHGKLLSDNFYWLSTKPDVLDWAKKEDTVYTPESAYADLSGLGSLPQTRVTTQARVAARGEHRVAHVVARNTGSQLAFMVHLRLTNSKGQDIAPIFWDDNYVSLLPGESRELTARFTSSRNQPVELAVDGWNVLPTSHEVLNKSAK